MSTTNTTKLPKPTPEIPGPFDTRCGQGVSSLRVVAWCSQGGHTWKSWDELSSPIARGV